MHVCRGLEGNCPSALWTDSSVVPALEDVLGRSSWLRRMAERHGGATLSHLRFKVALAACPNACTMPQIRDFGIIATQMPQQIGAECNGCGACQKACREQAMTVDTGRARIHPDRCVGCGVCIRACPQKTIQPSELCLRILVGGRMGRHPRWAEELCRTDASSAPGVLLAFLDCLEQEAQPAEGVAAFVERIGIDALQRRILRAAAE